MLLATISLIDLAVVAGIALVVPASLGVGWGWSLVAALSALGACVAEPGAVAVALTMPFGLLVVATARREAGRIGPVRTLAVEDVVQLGAVAFVAVAWAALACSSAGATPFGIGEPIVELTAVHFTFVGAGALPLAGSAWRRATGPCSAAVALVAVALTVGAPPVVALGFLVEEPLLLLAGGLLLTLGVWSTGALELRRAFDGRGPVLARVLFGVSGLAVVVPMVLAVSWAAGQHWDVPVLSIEDMVRTHGAGNAVGFVGAGLLATRLDRVVREEIPTWR